MSDYKEPYSEASRLYTSSTSVDSKVLAAYQRSKAREAKHNGEWVKRKVNINEICARFAPGDRGHAKNGKFFYEGPRYNVITDMSSGYLRIWDKERRCYVDLNGNPSKHDRNTHFKILRREEM